MPSDDEDAMEVDVGSGKGKGEGKGEGTQDSVSSAGVMTEVPKGLTLLRRGDGAVY